MLPIKLAPWLFLLSLTHSGVSAAMDAPSSERSSAVADAPPALSYVLNAEGLPFSDAVQVGSTLYLSGLLGLNADGNLVEGGITAQMTQTMENLRTALQQSGTSVHNVVKCTVILADIEDFAAMNAVYSRYFPADRLPTRTAFAARQLVMDARVEVECLAVVPS